VGPQARWLALAAGVAIASGVLLRGGAVARMDIWEDGVVYAEMGRSVARYGAFLLPDGERMGRSFSSGPGYSHHFPPAYPFALGLVFSGLGFGLWQAKLANLGISLAALAAVWATTRNLFGAQTARLVTGLVALDPGLVWVTGIGLSENLSLLFATLTIWAFLRSLHDVRFLLPTGVFWTVVYLARASAGPFGLLPAAAGAYWWSRFRGWRELLSQWCLAAGAIFVAAAGAWSWRNYDLFGSTATSLYMSSAIDWGLSQPALFGQALAGKGAFFGTLFLVYALAFAPELRASLRRLRDAETSALWLFVCGIWGLAWLVTAAFWPYEQKSFFSFDHQRYIVLGAVPLWWLALRAGGRERASLAWRWAGLAALLLVTSSLVVAEPIRRSTARAAEFLNLYLRDGDSIMLFGSAPKYDLSLHLERHDAIEVRTTALSEPPAFALFGDTLPDPLPPGYRLVGSFEQRGPVPSVTHVLAREAVVRERSVPTGLVQAFE
jgi:uncharacterized membrane protein YhaH (DUF805 family)